MTEPPPDRKRPTPVRSRPQMPAGYGIPHDSEGMFAWDDVREPLESAHLYWVATTRPDGRPHAVPLWGAWIDEAFYFEVSPDTRRGRNLKVNPAVVVHLEHGKLAIIIEGMAETVALDPQLSTRVADAFAAKYDYRPAGDEPWHRVQPRVVFAWDTFPTSPTRFHFVDR